MNENATHDSWFCAEGERAGLPVIIRGRQNLSSIIDATSHQKLLRITWQYAIADSVGLPDRNVAAQMSEFEDKIFDVLECDLLCVFFCVYTHNGIREWCAYSSDVQQCCNRINDTLMDETPYPIRMTVEDDPTWIEYQQLLAGVGDVG